MPRLLDLGLDRGGGEGLGQGYDPVSIDVDALQRPPFRPAGAGRSAQPWAQIFFEPRSNTGPSGLI